MVLPANTSEGDFVLTNATHSTEFNHDLRDLTSDELDRVFGGGNSIKADPSENHLSSSLAGAALMVTVAGYVAGAMMIAIGLVG